MPVLNSVRFCPHRRFCGPGVFWPLALVLVLLTALVPSLNAATRTAPPADDLFASPLEPVVSVGRENAPWRLGRVCERLRIPELPAFDLDPDGPYSLAPRPAWPAQCRVTAVAQPSGPSPLVRRTAHVHGPRAPPLPPLF